MDINSVWTKVFTIMLISVVGEIENKIIDENKDYFLLKSQNSLLILQYNR